MKKETKEIIRYILLAILMLGAYDLTNRAYLLEKDHLLTVQFAGIVASYLAIWGFVIKVFFTTTVSDDKINKIDN